MNGFKKIRFADLAAGDVVVAPASARALHSSPPTLSRHGLSNGSNSSRSENSAAFVAEVLSGAGKRSAFWVWYIADSIAAGTDARGVNDLSVLVPRRRINYLTLVPAGPGMLPENRDTSGKLANIWPVENIKDAVAALWKEKPARLEKTPMRLYGTAGRGSPADDGWTRLRALYDGDCGIRGDVVSSVPADDRLVYRNNGSEPFRRVFRVDEDLARRLGASGWSEPGWSRRLRVDRKFAEFMEANGAEAWRPRKQTVERLARKVLAMHARRCADQLAAADREFAAQVRKAGDELGELRACAAWWAERAAKLAGKEEP